MAYVQLNESGVLTGVFSGPQRAPLPNGYAEIADDDPRLAAFHGPSSIITATEFLNRFTDVERDALATEAQSNSQMLLLLITLAAAAAVDLSDPQVVNGIDGLVGTVLADQARANAILAY